jgi:hypothetical protein
MNAQGWSHRVLLERELDPVRAFALAHYLDAHGIPVFLAERPLSGAMGEIPFQEIPAEIYLEDASRLNDARELIRRFRLGPQGVRGAVWRCAACGETHEPEFGACWNCGAARP